MAITTQTITGTVFRQDGTFYDDARIRFVLSKGDIEGTDIVRPYQKTVDVGADGTFSVDLWQNDSGNDGDSYYYVTIFEDSSTKPYPQGIIQLTSGGSTDYGALITPVTPTQITNYTYLATSGVEGVVSGDIVLGTSDATFDVPIVGDAVMQNGNDNTTGAIARIFTGGIGGILSSSLARASIDDIDEASNPTALYFVDATTTGTKPGGGSIPGTNLHISRGGSTKQQFFISTSGRLFSRSYGGGTWTGWNEYWSDTNTTVDGSGFIKEASPILYLTGNDLTWNHDVPDDTVTVEHVSTGVYVIRGTNGPAVSGWQRQRPSGALGLPSHDVDLSWDETLGELTVTVCAADYSGTLPAAGALADLPDGVADPLAESGVTMLRLADF